MLISSVPHSTIKAQYRMCRVWESSVPKFLFSLHPSKSAMTEPARRDGMWACAQIRTPKAEAHRITCMSTSKLSNIKEE